MDEPSIAFHPLSFVPQRDGVMVGRADTNTFVALPDDGAELLRRMVDGESPEQAAGWYRSTFGETVDLDDFVGTLTELGFVRAPGEPAAERPSVRYRRLGRAMFSPAAWIAYACLVAATGVAMVRQPELRPNPDHVFFLPSLIAVQVILVLSQIPGLLAHEWFHVMAGRRHNLPTRLRVGRRLFFAVFETELNGLLSLPRSQRHVAFLAGMLGDVLIAAALTLAAAVEPGHWLAQLALAVAYLTLIRLAWQLLIFLRTDLYYVLTTALGCTNLTGAAKAWLRDRVRRLRGVPPVPADADEWSDRDRRYAPWFALLTVVGTAALLGVLAIAAVPVFAGFAVRLRDGLEHGLADPVKFWDSAASLAVLSVQFGVFPLVAGLLSRAGKPAPNQESVTAQGVS
ncbi:hypothetical protein [Lentzea sp. NPDC059081]|uniref:hypothetical protein n=1 Tax=Lentzea sp. NPDC059081 TaxID=3346719 RepID=UPI0036912652